jgi:hypothetical protein
MLILACMLWPVWLFGVDNSFTMGYTTPLVRKVALTVVGLAITMVLWRLKGIFARTAAVVIAIITWLPLGMLWWFG